MLDQVTTTDGLYMSTRDIMEGQQQGFNSHSRRRRNAEQSVTEGTESHIPESKTLRYLAATGLVAYGAGIFYIMLKDLKKNRHLLS